MPRASLVPIAPGSRFVCIREDLLAICKDDHCAAALLHELIWLCDQTVEESGEPKPFDRSLRQLEAMLLGHYSRTSVSVALEKLQGLGYIAIHATSPCCRIEVHASAVQKRTELSNFGQHCQKFDSQPPADTSYIARASSDSSTDKQKEEDPPLPPLQDPPDPDSRIDRWLAETATAKCRTLTAKERRFLIEADSPALRERLAGPVREASDPTLTALRMAGYGHARRTVGQQSGGMGWTAPSERARPQKPPPPPCPSRDAMTNWLTEHEIPTKHNGVPCWKWDEVNVFRLTYPNYFEEEVYAEVFDLIDDSHDGSLVLGMLYEIIKEPGRRKKAAEFERE